MASAALSTSSANSVGKCSTSVGKTLMSKFPIGFGTFMLSKEEESIQAALNNGYRRIDCAPVYFNEHRVGDAIRDYISNNEIIKREDLYIVSKLASPFHKKEYVEPAVRKTLHDLRLDYLDLLLVHWPVAFYPVPIPKLDANVRGWDNEDIDDSNNGKNIDSSVSVHETWEAMEDLVHKGLVKSIGVSNFPVILLHELISKAKIIPAVNQVELHPYNQQNNLIKYCNHHNIHVQAYSPLGTPGFAGEENDPVKVLDDPTLKQIADNHSISVAQVCLLWALQRNTSVVVKSASSDRQKENMNILFDDNNNGDEEEVPKLKLRLSDEEMEQIASLDRGYRFFRPEEWWGDYPLAVFH